MKSRIKDQLDNRYKFMRLERWAFIVTSTLAMTMLFWAIFLQATYLN